ncbi:MAG: ABC transporter ATP-binding protein [Gemmatimonadota bacterium]
MNVNPYRPFSPYLRPYRRYVAIGLVLLIVEQAIISAMPMVLRRIIDTVRAFMDGAAELRLYTSGIRGDVALYAGLVAGLALVQWLAAIGMRWYFTSVSRFVERDIRRSYVHHLLLLPIGYFQERRVGDLMARATNDVEAVQRFLNQAFRMTLTAILSFALSLTLMCTIDWRLALYALAPMPVMAISTRWVSQRVRHGFRQVQEQFAAMSARIQESLSGVRVVKAYAREPLEIAEFAELNEAYVERNRRLVRIRSILFPFAFLLNGVSMVVILWLGGLRVIEGTLTLGAFVAFNAYLIRLGRPMMLLGRMVDEYQRAAASLARIETVFHERPQELDEGVLAPDLAGRVELRHVSFAYDGHPVLKDIDLTVPAGSSLALVGRVGSGKSTLARLIPRLIEASAGQVLVDGIPVADLPLAALRGAIGYVPQDSFLFSETIAENVRLGRAGAAGDGDDTLPAAPEVAWAAEVAQLTRDLADFPAGLDTLVGERGITLSGGQKQRTALARAVIRQPRILILDDALASVDTGTEERILAGLRQIMKSRTTIIIAHRLSTVRDADCIAVLDDGRIAELGTHDQLLALDGIYADMYRRQHLAEELTVL